MRATLGIVALTTTVLGCGGGKADDCQRFVDKAWPVLDKLMAKVPATAKRPKPSKATLVEMCRKAPRRDASMDCVLAAADQAAVEACLSSAFTDYMNKGKASELKVRANMLAKGTKAAYAENAAFPVATTDWVPAASCCARPGHTCPFDAAAWEVAPFRDLDFMIEDASRIRVRYQGTADAYTAVLWSDDDCDDEQDPSEVVTVRGRAESGNPIVDVEAP